MDKPIEPARPIAIYVGYVRNGGSITGIIKMGEKFFNVEENSETEIGVVLKVSEKELVLERSGKKIRLFLLKNE